VDDDWVLALEVKDPDLEKRSVGRRSNQHREFVIDELADGVTHGVLDVLIGDSVFSCRFTDPHARQLSLSSQVLSIPDVHLGAPRLAFRVPPVGIEPTTFGLKVAHLQVELP